MRSYRGFTLLEVLIAISILALMATMIWQITSNASRGVRKAEGYDAIYHEGRVALRKITEDLSMAFLTSPTFQGRASDGTPLIETGFVGEDKGDADEINFTSFSNMRFVKDVRESDQVEVGWFVTECPEKEEHCLMRRRSAVIDKDVKEGGDAQPVAKNLKGFDLKYYDSKMQDWRDDWSSKDPDLSNRLPRAVRITLTFNDPREEGKEIVFPAEVMLPMQEAIEF